MRHAQQQAADFAREHGLLLSPQGRFVDLVSEVGELGKELLKATGYETEAFVDRVEIAQEQALPKQEKRFAQKGHIGSGETI